MDLLSVYVWWQGQVVLFLSRRWSPLCSTCTYRHTQLQLINWLASTEWSFMPCQLRHHYIRNRILRWKESKWEKYFIMSRVFEERNPEYKRPSTITLHKVMLWLCRVGLGHVEEWSFLDVSANTATDYGGKEKADQSNSRPPTLCPLPDLYRTPSEKQIRSPWRWKLWDWPKLR